MAVEWVVRAKFRDGRTTESTYPTRARARAANTKLLQLAQTTSGSVFMREVAPNTARQLAAAVAAGRSKK